MKSELYWNQRAIEEYQKRADIERKIGTLEVQLAAKDKVIDSQDKLIDLLHRDREYWFDCAVKQRRACWMCRLRDWWEKR